jgi:putative transposase
MGRAPRGEYAGGIFHVTTRGNNRRGVFVDELDRHVFLQMLGRSQATYEWILYAWCLMTTHYHLVVRIPKCGLSQGMCELNGSFARWSNGRHGREDHLFGRRFASHEIKTDAYLREACRYVVLNPCRAGLCAHPQQWRWSSFRAAAGIEPPPAYLARHALLGLFTDLFGTPPNETAAAYRRFVEGGL